MKLLAGREEDLAEITTTEETNGEYCTTLHLQEALNAELLRFEFSDGQVELYEIELF